MKLIEKTFTYDLPDDYLAQTNELGKTATWTYSGPDKIWVFIDKETCKYVRRHLSEDENGADYPTPLDQYKVLVNCEEEPLLACLFHLFSHIDYATLEQHNEELPDGTSYIRPLNPPPDHTYEVMDLVYNPETNTFNKPYPWKQPHMDWEGIRNWRNSELARTDNFVGDHMPTQLNDAWADYRQKLRDLPQVHGATESGATPDTAPWKIQPIGAPDGSA